MLGECDSPWGTMAQGSPELPDSKVLSGCLIPAGSWSVGLPACSRMNEHPLFWDILPQMFSLSKEYKLRQQNQEAAMLDFSLEMPATSLIFLA